jgi:DNA polymerase-3 subunit epsilon
VRRRSPLWPQPVYWALDLETGGLDPARNPVLSVGMVPVRDGVVKVGESLYSLMKASAHLDEDSLAVHHILPGEVGEAPSRRRWWRRSTRVWVRVCCWFISQR